MKTTRQFGLWDSPVTPRSLSVDKRLGEICWDDDGKTLLWTEGRSDRGVLVAQGGDGQAARDLTSDLSVRAEVGYGGGDCTARGGHAYFVVHKTGRIFRQPLAGGAARPVTPAFGKAAAPVVSPCGRWLVYVHHDDQQVDRLAIVDVEGNRWPQILAAGHDFYMQPRFSPDGRYLAFVAWDHPNMPWDGTQLRLATVEANDRGMPTLGDSQVVAGDSDTAIFQPEFSPDGRTLYYVSDESGWGRLAARDVASGKTRWLTANGTELLRPAWVQGTRSYAAPADGKSLVAACNRDGFDSLERIDLSTGKCETISALSEYTQIDSLAASQSGAFLAIVASAPRIPPRVVRYDLESREATVVARSTGETMPAAALSQCQALTWNSADGETVHGLHYPPASEQFAAEGLPPLIVLIHGGPTGQTKAAFSPQAQFFATRGYAVLSVNYRGSTGYGRQYMLRLRGNWGVCDVQDAVSGADRLGKLGLADRTRCVIMGGSAGGFTVLQTLVEQPESFAAGISLYGVANQFNLASDTHKFEARYLDSLLGPLPAAAALYRARSPVFHAQAIRRPLAVFQGAIDQVVPKEQSDSIVEALRRNGVPHVYHVYEGEGHGWRKSETIVHFYQAVEDFLKKYVLYA